MSAVLPDKQTAGRLGEAARTIVETHLPTAAERLAASRARLRAALMEISHPPPKPSILDDLGLGGIGNDLLGRLKGLPGAGIVLETLHHWWKDHPLHTAGKVAEEASRRFVGPIARRNPYGVIAGSIALGALFAVSRPWRWLLRPALFVGLVPQLASQALKHLPVESWLSMLTTLGSKRPAMKAQKAPPASSCDPADAGIGFARGPLNRLPPNGPLPTRPRGPSAGLPPWGL